MEEEQDPGFVFVAVTGADHKGDRKLLPKLRQHVMLRHVHSKRNKERSSSRALLAVPDTETSQPSSTRSSAEPPHGLPPRTSAPPLQQVKADYSTMVPYPQSLPAELDVKFDPFDALPAAGIDDLSDLLRYFSFGQPSSEMTPWRTGVLVHWYQKHWQISREDDVTFNLTVCWALERKAYYTKQPQPTRLFYHKANLLKSLRKRIAADPANVSCTCIGAVAALAYNASREEDWEMAKNHVNAIKRLARFEKYDEHVWLYTIWADFRLAAATNTAPVLSYYIPTAFRDRHPSNHPVARRCANLIAENCADLPSCADIGFSDQVKSDLVRELHIAASVVEDTFGDNIMRLYGPLYQLLFNIATLNALGWSCDSNLDEVKIIRCVMLAMQIWFWTSTRFIVPYNARAIVQLHWRLLEQLQSLGTNLTETWQMHGHPRSLLWVLFIGCANAIDNYDAAVPGFLELLKEVLAVLQIKDEAAFSAAVQKWPSTRHWSQRLIPRVWSASAGGWDASQIKNEPRPMCWMEEYPHVQ